MYPLPATGGCLLLDGVDQTIFQTLGYDTPFYQSYDKAMGVFYLSVVYLASLRNWTNQAAVRVSRGRVLRRTPSAEAGGLAWRFRADPLPAEIDEARKNAAYQAAHRKVFDATALEKTFLIGLISVISGQVLPGSCPESRRAAFNSSSASPPFRGDQPRDRDCGRQSEATRGTSLRSRFAQPVDSHPFLVSSSRGGDD
jgi:hypothetical protein